MGTRVAGRAVAGSLTGMAAGAVAGAWGEKRPVVRTFGEEVGTLTVSPLSDIHIGSPHFMLREFETFLGAVAADEYHRLVLNGDYVENITRSSVGDIWEQRMTPREQVREVARMLMPLRDRIDLVTSGNHDERTAKDTSFDAAELLAERLGVDEAIYQPDGGFVIYRLGRSDHRSTRDGVPKPQVYSVYATHNRGGGQLSGSKIIKGDRIGDAWPADVVLLGHVHDMITHRRRKPAVIDLHNYRVRLEDQLIVIAGSFLGHGGYAQRAGMRATAIGMPRAVLYGQEHRFEAIS